MGKARGAAASGARVANHRRPAKIMRCKIKVAPPFIGKNRVAAKSEKSPKSAMTVEEARALLRKSKLRSTASRLAVLERLSVSDGPVSHAELADEMVPLGFDKSTIYRVLIELADSEIVSRIDAGDHAWRFELKSEHGGHSSSDHPHFVCNDCGKIE